MSDLEPASALASRVVGDLFDSTGERADVWRVEQLIDADRAAVREPLEKRNRELETLVCDEREVILQQRKALDGLETDLTQIRDYLPTDWTNETVRGGEAMLVVKKKWDECRRQDERIASLEAQLASAREGCWRPAASELPPDAFTRLVWCGFRTVAFCEDGKWWRVGEEGKNVELTGVHFWRDLPEGPSIERVHAALIAAEQATSCHCGTPSLAHDVACPQHEDAAQKEPHGR